MITPFEIENKVFSKAMRGYNIDEVDEYLDQIILDLEKLLAENNNLKSKVKELNLEIENHKKSESSVLNTLESAKHLMNDISASAEKRAEVIIKNAKLDAEVIQRDAKESVAKLLDEGAKLTGKVTRYKERYKQMLEDELNQIEGSSSDLLADLEVDFMPASLDVKKVETVVDQRSMPKSEPKTKVEEKRSSDTVVIGEKSLEEMLREDFASSNNDPAKTRII